MNEFLAASDEELMGVEGGIMPKVPPDPIIDRIIKWIKDHLK